MAHSHAPRPRAPRTPQASQAEASVELSPRTIMRVGVAVEATVAGMLHEHEASLGAILLRQLRSDPNLRQQVMAALGQ